jgi:hypothetical protein
MSDIFCELCGQPLDDDGICLRCNPPQPRPVVPPKPTPVTDSSVRNEQDAQKHLQAFMRRRRQSEGE